VKANAAEGGREAPSHTKPENKLTKESQE